MAPNNSGTAHAAIQANNAEFLAYASSKPAPVQLGTIASGSSGGSLSGLVSFNPNEPVVVPRWAQELEIYVELPYTITVPTGATCYVSPFGAWATLINQLSIAGSPPWDNISLVPFYLDEIVRRRGWDPVYSGPSPYAIQQDQGPWTYDTGNVNVVPGAALPAGTYSGTLKFTARIRLQRRLHTCFGMVPMGASNDRPVLKLFLAPLVGNQPENNFIQDPANSGATASLTANGTVILVWRSLGLDQLPAGVAPATPTVGLGLEIDYYATSIQNAGQVVQDPHKSAMLYQYTYNILVSNAQVVEADYFASLLTGELQNARFAYDASENNFQSYYKDVQDRYQRFLPKGVYVNDMVGGHNPELPSETPYIGAMASDQGYADAFGVAYTPAMATALRFPAGTTMTNAYIATYSFGYVEVPY